MACQGTIKDYPSFNVEADCECLRKAMAGAGTDENAITNILAGRSNAQRQEIQKKYPAMFGKSLKDELKSELSGNYEDTILYMLLPADELDAHILHDAISGGGTDEKALIEVLSSRGNAEIKNAAAVYKKKYKADLAKDIQGDTSGNFGKFMYSLAQGERQESEELCQAKAGADARTLYDAGEGKWGTDEVRFNVIMATRSLPQLALMCDEYERISKRTMEGAIKSEMSGDVETAMLAVVKCARSKPAYFAEMLYKSMKGLGTDDKTLIRIMVSRSEIDMVQIKESFSKLYQKSLESFISGDCSGDYKKILLKICAGN